VTVFDNRLLGIYAVKPLSIIPVCSNLKSL